MRTLGNAVETAAALITRGQYRGIQSISPIMLTWIKARYFAVKWWAIGCTVQGHQYAFGLLLAAPLQFLTERYRKEAQLFDRVLSVLPARPRMCNGSALAPAQCCEAISNSGDQHAK
jgi:hypothetical protein